MLLNTPIPNDIPYNDFYEYYAPDFKLHLTASSSMENMNRPEQLDAITSRILQNLKYLQAAPSVQMHAVPPDWVINSAVPQEIEDAKPDERTPALNSDGSTRRQADAEFYEDEREGSREVGGNADDEDSSKRRRLLYPAAATAGAKEASSAGEEAPSAGDAMDISVPAAPASTEEQNMISQ